jgi:hypothetical protein
MEQYAWLSENIVRANGRERAGREDLETSGPSEATAAVQRQKRHLSKEEGTKGANEESVEPCRIVGKGKG